MGILITLAGIPVYYFGVVWKDKPKFVQNAIGKSTHAQFTSIIRKWVMKNSLININSTLILSGHVTEFCQKFLVSAKEEKCD